MADLGSSPTQLTQKEGTAGGRSVREVLRTGAFVAIAVLITLFAVFNLEDVKVNWIFGSDRAPLIVVILISLVAGVLLTYVAERLVRRHGETGKRGSQGGG